MRFWTDRFFGRPTRSLLLIAAARRRTGLGTALLAFLERRVGEGELWTSTNLSNSPMQRLLAGRGYQLTGFIENLDPGDPELIYFKRLTESGSL